MLLGDLVAEGLGRSLKIAKKYRNLVLPLDVEILMTTYEDETKFEYKVREVVYRVIYDIESRIPRVVPLDSTTWKASDSMPGIWQPNGRDIHVSPSDFRICSPSC